MLAESAADCCCGFGQPVRAASDLTSSCQCLSVVRRPYCRVRVLGFAPVTPDDDVMLRRVRLVVAAGSMEYTICREEPDDGLRGVFSGVGVLCGVVAGGLVVGRGQRRSARRSTGWRR